MRGTQARLAPFVLLCALSGAITACGEDEAGSPDAAPDDEPDADVGPDAEPPAGACGATVGTIDGEGSFSGTLAVADGADFDVAMGECANEVSYFAQVGPDAVVAVTGLTAGASYTARLVATGDLGVYVAASCDADGPAAGACLGFTDRAGAGVADVALFTAPDGGTAYVIVDVFGENLLADGAFTLTIGTPECEDASDCGGGDGVCFDYACSDCETSFDCDGTTPVCTAGDCVTGPAECTGDDAPDTGASTDDGPTGATALTLPTVDAPTEVTAAVCSLPAMPREEDWFTFTTAATQAFQLVATWADTTTDIDFRLLDATGAVVASAAGTAPGTEPMTTPALAAGTYYVVVVKYGPMAVAAATPYTLTMSLPECSTSFDCASADEPVCSAGSCVAGPDGCTGDDAGDTVGDDDGPAGATLLTSGVPAAAAICNATATEFDFFAFDVAQSGSATLELSWAGSADLDLAVFDAAGAVHGVSFWARPESVHLTYLPEGRYYVRVMRVGTASAVVDAYTMTVTVAAGTACATVNDCAAAYTTQFFRGACVDGACEAIPAGSRAAGALCDSGDDCASGRCSYVAFEGDAADSICTTTCTTTDDCTAISAGATCTMGAVQQCVPGCNADLQCGANPNSGTLDDGQVWDYYSCDEVTEVCTY